MQSHFDSSFWEQSNVVSAEVYLSQSKKEPKREMEMK